MAYNKYNNLPKVLRSDNNIMQFEKKVDNLLKIKCNYYTNL